MTIEDNGPPLPCPEGLTGDELADSSVNEPHLVVHAQHPHGKSEVPDSEPAPERSSGARAFFDWVAVIAVALLVAFVVRGFVLAHFVVEGQSMATTLETGDRVFVNKLSYRLHDPNRGDVVVLHQITGTSERDLIKRVVGLPGETIEMTGCVVRITEQGSDAPQILDEPYLDKADRAPGTCGPDVTSQVVPDDHVFVMGDNRGGSQDSRALGPISEDDLVGRAFIVFWPRHNWQWL
ncbi:MAG: signal peptidase I [Ilumatobacter sp.]|nr:signal peptidase I [Ilumatobacter sp.]